MWIADYATTAVFFSLSLSLTLGKRDYIKSSGVHILTRLGCKIGGFCQREGIAQARGPVASSRSVTNGGPRDTIVYLCNHRELSSLCTRRTFVIVLNRRSMIFSPLRDDFFSLRDFRALSTFERSLSGKILQLVENTHFFAFYAVSGRLHLRLQTNSYWSEG